MTAKEKRFVKFVRNKCKEHGVKFDLRRTKVVTLSDNIKCSGYFDEEEPRLVVAKNRPDWLQILVHQYSHLTQWVENCSEWKNGCIGITKVDEWLNGTDVKNIKKYLALSRDLELDNEKRSVALIKKWDLDIDVDEYTRKANAYVLFYNYLYHTRRWSDPKNSPYTNQNIIGKMSNKFNMRYNEMSKKYLELFQKENV